MTARDNRDFHLRQFELRIYNKIVRDLIEAGETNDTAWQDSWADAHYQTVYARDAYEARRTLDLKYPADQGFVITHVIEIEDDFR